MFLIKTKIFTLFISKTFFKIHVFLLSEHLAKEQQAIFKGLLLTLQYNKHGFREHTATVAYLRLLIRNLSSSGYSVQSTRGKVWRLCAFCSW